jgi:hypothetical protein
MAGQLICGHCTGIIKTGLVLGFVIGKGAFDRGGNSKKHPDKLIEAFPFMPGG